jgi:hypothetical protein
MSRRIVLIAAAAVLMAGGATAAAVGGGVLVAVGTDGTVSSGGHTVSTATAAFVTEPADISGRGTRELGHPTVTVSARGSDKPVFIGVGPAAEVQRYLAGAPVETVTDVEVNPFELTTTRRGGDAQLSPPGDESFWVEQASGARSASTTWKIRDGSYSVVLMNADGSRGVQVAAGAAVEIPYLTAISTVLVGGGLGALALGATLLVVGVRIPETREPTVVPEQTPVSVS